MPVPRQENIVNFFVNADDTAEIDLSPYFGREKRVVTGPPGGAAGVFTPAALLICAQGRIPDDDDGVCSTSLIWEEE